MRKVRSGWLWYAETIIQNSFVSAYQSHVPVPSFCGKHYLQGVWEAARHPSGEREGRSPLASWMQRVKERGSALGGVASHTLLWSGRV